MYRDPEKTSFEANVCTVCLIGLAILGLIALFSAPEAKPAGAAKKWSLEQALKEAPVEWLLVDLCNPEHKGYCQKNHIYVRFPALQGVKAELKVTTKNNGKTINHKPVLKSVTKTYLVPGSGKLGQTMVMMFDLGLGKHEAELKLTYQGETRKFRKSFQASYVPKPRPRKKS